MISKQVTNKKSRKNPHLRRICAWDFRKMDEKQFQLKMCSWAIVKIHQTWLQKIEMQISHKHNAFKRVLSKICSLATSKMRVKCMGQSEEQDL